MVLSIERETKIPLALVPDWLAGHGFHRPTLRTVQAWVEKGRLRKWKIGGKVYTSVEALEEMANGECLDARPASKAKQKRKQNTKVDEKADAAADAVFREIGWA